jgi:Fe2+ or Zn2+ uptake regulation protein
MVIITDARTTHGSGQFESCRLSRQGRAILDVLVGADDHPTAEQVLARARRRLPHVSLGTVYRNLDKLISCGQAIRVPGGDDRMHFDARTGQHCHARCMVCGRVVDVELEVGKKMTEQAQDQTGFRVSGANLVFEGLCPECAQKKGEPKE